MNNRSMLNAKMVKDINAYEFSGRTGDNLTIP